MGGVSGFEDIRVAVGLWSFAALWGAVALATWKPVRRVRFTWPITLTRSNGGVVSATDTSRTASQRKSDVAKREDRTTPRLRSLQIQEQKPKDRAQAPPVIEKLLQDVQPRSVQLPLSATTWATLSAPFPLSDEAWGQMIMVLNAMKPALVAIQVEGPDSMEPVKSERGT